MKKKLLFSVLVLMILASILLCSCMPDNKPDVTTDKADDTQQPPETVDPSAAIDLKDYVMIRPDSSSKTLTSAAVDLRMAIQKKCGYMLDMKTDFSGSGALEIVIGKTKRGGTDGLNKAEYIIKHTEKGFLIAGGSDEATIVALKFFEEKLLSESGALCASDFEYKVDNSFKIGAKSYDEVKIFVGFSIDNCTETIIAKCAELGVPATLCTKESEANIVLTNDSNLKVKDVPSDNWGVVEQNGILYVVGRSDYDMIDACSYITDYFKEFNGKIAIPEGVLKINKNVSKEEFYTQTRLIVYPEFPERIRRDYMYSVSVTQGDKTASLPVYNHCQTEPAYSRDNVGGDNYRRFSIFAFSGEQVRVDIKVGCDFKNYCVLPSAKEFKSEFKDGVISVYLDKPEYFVVRLDDDTNTVLSILADYPEYPLDIPSKDDPKVTWISGVVEPENGVTILKNQGETLYIEPGAVLFSRVKITGKDCKVLGRGAMVDPYENFYKFNPEGQSESKGVKFMQMAGDNGLFDGPVLLDARCYNFNIGGANITVRNGKALSVMITSDGFQFLNGCVIERSFVHVGDNGLVFAGKNNTVRDVTIGTTCAAIFPQDGSSNINMENIYVFRSDGGLINNFYNYDMKTQGPIEREHGVTITGLYADDCTSLPWFFQGRDMGRLAKVFNITNATSCSTRGVVSIYGIHNRSFVRFESTEGTLFTDNYTLNIKNLYVDGKLVKSADDLNVSLSGANKNPKNEINVEYDDTKVVTRKNIKVDYKNSINVYIGSLQVFFESPVVSKDGAVYLPAAEILNYLRTDKAVKTEKIDGVDYVTNTVLVSSGIAKKAEISGNSLVITPVYNGENLLLPDSGDIPYYVESIAYRGDLTAEDVDGEIVYRAFNLATVGAGMVRGITDEVMMYGTGKYVLEFQVSGSGLLSTRFCLGTSDKFSDYLSHIYTPLKAGWNTVRVTVNADFDLRDCEFFAFMIEAGDAKLKSFDIKNITLKKIS